MPLKLNIGCGSDKRKGYINIDKNPENNPDVIIDLETGKLPFKDNSVAKILAFQIFEHINNLEALVNELYRVMKKGAILKISVPYKNAQLSLEHVRIFDENYFKSWDKAWYESKHGKGKHLFDFNFKTKTIRLTGNKIALLLPFKTWRGFFDHLISGIYIELIKK